MFHIEKETARLTGVRLEDRLIARNLERTLLVRSNLNLTKRKKRRSRRGGETSLHLFSFAEIRIDVAEMKEMGAIGTHFNERDLNCYSWLRS